MGSARFPGKVLAPFRGRPLIASVIARVSEAGPGAIVVATTTESTDDPLVAYLHQLDVPVFRGQEANVVARFQACLADYPCRWFLRVCADSPLIDGNVMREILRADRSSVDLI